MRRRIPSVLRFKAKASPCSMTTDWSSWASSTSYVHIDRYSVRASPRRAGRTAVTAITADTWSRSVSPSCCPCWVIAGLRERVASRVCVAMVRPPVFTYDEMSAASLEESKHHTAQDGEQPLLLWGFSTCRLSCVLERQMPTKGCEFSVRDGNR